MFGLPSAFGYKESENALAQLWTEERRREFDMRRETARIIRQVDSNSYGAHVVSFLSRKFHWEIFNKLLLDGGINTENNVLRDLADRICVGFTRGVQCRLLGKDNQPVDSPEFQTFTGPKVLNFNGVGADVERKCKLYGPVFAMPWCAYSERRGERVMGIRTHTPETYDLIIDPGNPNDYVAVIIFDEVWESQSALGGKMIKRMRATIWTRQTWCVWTQSDRERWDKGPDNPNPFNAIPGVRISDSEVEDCTWPYADGARWAEAAVRNSAWETYKDYLGPAQVKTLIGEFDDTFPSGQILRQGGAVTLGKAIGVQVADFQTDLEAWDKAMIEKRRTRLVVSTGLRADELTQDSTAPESGIARKLRNADRDQDVIRRQGPIKRGLEELYGMAWWVAYVEMSRAGAAPICGLDALPPGAPPFRSDFNPVANGRDFTVSIDPNDLVYAETEQERQMRVDYDVKNGYSDRVEEMMRINPNLSRDEADALLMARMARESTYNNKAAVRMEALRQQAGGMPSSQQTAMTMGNNNTPALNMDAVAPGRQK